MLFLILLDFLLVFIFVSIVLCYFRNFIVIIVWIIVVCVSCMIVVRVENLFVLNVIGFVVFRCVIEDIKYLLIRGLFFVRLYISVLFVCRIFIFLKVRRLLLWILYV